jgi:hypothetical protein
MDGRLYRWMGKEKAREEPLRARSGVVYSWVSEMEMLLV